MSARDVLAVIWVILVTVSFIVAFIYSLPPSKK